MSCFKLKLDSVLVFPTVRFIFKQLRLPLNLPLEPLCVAVQQKVVIFVWFPCHQGNNSLWQSKRNQTYKLRCVFNWGCLLCRCCWICLWWPRFDICFGTREPAHLTWTIIQSRASLICLLSNWPSATHPATVQLKLHPLPWQMALVFVLLLLSR